MIKLLETWAQNESIDDLTKEAVNIFSQNITEPYKEELRNQNKTKN